LPLKDFLFVLKQIGYEGFLSLEWEKLWRPEIAEPEVVFPHYIKRMKELFMTI